MKCSILFFLFFLFSLLGMKKLFAQDSLLFIGNSLTSYNDMPKMYKEISSNMGGKTYVDCSTFSGSSLRNHTTSYVYKNKGFNVYDPPNNRILEKKYKVDTLSPILPSTLLKIKENSFNKIVIQEHPIYLLNTRLRDSLSMDALDSIKSYANDNVSFYINSNYAGKNYTKSCLNIKKWNEGCTYVESYCPPSFKSFNQLNDSLLFFSRELAKRVNGYVIPLCNVFEYFRVNHPRIRLYKFGNHPTRSSSYIMACVYFALINDNREFDNFKIKKWFRHKQEIKEALTKFFQIYDSSNQE